MAQLSKHQTEEIYFEICYSASTCGDTLLPIFLKKKSSVRCQKLVINTCEQEEGAIQSCKAYMAYQEKLLTL